MLVALNSHWKIPVGYFLIKGIGSQDKATLVNTCLRTVHDTGVIVRTFTFDGTSTKITMYNKLGANIFSENAVTNKSVHIFLDPAHMLKLCRNTLSDWKNLFNENERVTKLEYLEKLVVTQDGLGIHFATKIRNRHINFTKEKMKVRIAAQTLSKSVADALRYCKNTVKLKEFAMLR